MVFRRGAFRRLASVVVPALLCALSSAPPSGMAATGANEGPCSVAVTPVALPKAIADAADPGLAASIEAALNANLAWMGYAAVGTGEAGVALGSVPAQAGTQQDVRRLLSQTGASGLVGIRVLCTQPDNTSECLIVAWGPLGDPLGTRVASGAPESIGAAAAALVSDTLTECYSGPLSAARIAARAALRSRIVGIRANVNSLMRKIHDNDRMALMRQLQRIFLARTASTMETQTDLSLSQLSETYWRQIAQLEEQVVDLQAQIEATGVSSTYSSFAPADAQGL